MDHFDKVMVADVRDTYFQSNPFEANFGSDFVGNGGEEDGVFITYLESKTIKDCAWNKGFGECFRLKDFLSKVW